MPTMIPCAYLRVFRPLETFPEPDRSQWERYILSGGAPPHHRPIYRDESTEKERHVGLMALAEGEYADIRLVDGQYFVCPWRTRLRVLSSLLSLRDSAPSEVAEAFVPEGEFKRAARELARLKRREPWAVPSMLQSPWHVPIRWFILVDDPERRLVEAGSDQFRLFYWTPLGAAKKRAERALQVLRRSELAPLATVVGEMAEWLSAFHPKSMVELDYASVSTLFTWDELDDDHGGHEIQEAVEAIAERGGMARAAEIYQTVANRWTDAMNRESLN
jgi:hypothetical protein